MNVFVLTGIMGLLASVVVGAGEYLLHYDPLARFADGGFGFMQGINVDRTSLGHFLGVFGALLYPVGCYHLYLMLKPASNKLAFSAFIIGSMGFMVGVVWIGSRASISALMQLPESAEIDALVALYDLRYETLLQVVRVTTLLLSVIFVVLIFKGKTHYPKWMAFFNPILLIVASFLVYLVAPQLGKHVMPIALNVAFFIVFSLSLFMVFKNKPSVCLVNGEAKK
ncbi:hypothetical protein MUS1_06480 [Marinomonas ushuaiensis DSM 15871]|uniref:Uncharacterized protein n=1 Tax=Marinomonas ushuaiensis DSM 15871 TaxID=1122207 RepID=X7E3A2_9GAMM|nr:DUF6796 family protein [Marinomonas ushuaiensis]ETX09658.1 hypothetical protein MUS1_06480 [Marinomonas ushuaiensis DSM 15871]